MLQHLFSQSGEIDFRGTMAQLLHAISRMDGTLKTNQQFRCPLKCGTLGRGILKPGFVCHCKYVETAAGFHISYRVLPTFPTGLLMLLPLILALGVCFNAQDSAVVFFSLLVGLFIFFGLGALLFWRQSKGIAGFLDILSKEQRI